MRTIPRTSLVATVVAMMAGPLTGCDIGKITVNTTSKVLVRAQPSLKQEADYELAARALPGTLKTVEGFWLVDPGNARLLAILTEGYCQYAIGFVEDEWEEADRLGNKEAVTYHSTRATKMFTRCLNYALKTLGRRWQEQLFGNTETVTKLISSAGSGQRIPLMWAGLALGALINQNKNVTALLPHLSTAKAILLKIVEMDAKHAPSDKMIAAIPHVALGLVYTALPTALGGQPEKATEHFKKALTLTDNKFLMARVHWAKRVGVQMQDCQLFRREILTVLQTDPAIWPDQRLANEIAHRKANRYLKMEAALFPDGCTKPGP